jgi:hypothetical protein
MTRGNPSTIQRKDAASPAMKPRSQPQVDPVEFLFSASLSRQVEAVMPLEGRNASVE